MMNAILQVAQSYTNRLASLPDAAFSQHRSISIAKLTEIGNRLHKAGRIGDAETIFRQILRHQPHNPIALLSLGIIASQTGQLRAAIELMTRATEIAPTYYQAFNNLGTVYAALNQHYEAAEQYSKAIALRPEYADAHFNLGVARRNLEQFEGALSAFSECKRIAPRRADVHFEIGQCQEKLGHRLGAQIAYWVVLNLEPDHVKARLRLGKILTGLGRCDAAIEQFQTALDASADDSLIMNGLADALKRTGRFEDALEELRRALEVDPDGVETVGILASVHQSMGDVDHAADYYRRALELAPHAEFAERSSLFVALNRPGVSSDELFALHRHLRSRHDRPEARTKDFPERDRDPDRKLRIGYVSSDFRTHVVALNILPLIANHDRTRHEVFLYSQERSTDQITEMFKGFATRYTAIDRYTDAQVAAMIEQDEIDILVLLAGRFDENRPLIAIHRPAPIQVSFHDCATSGLEAMDYWLTDSLLHAEDTPEKFTEQLYRLPVYYQYPVQEGLPTISPPPALTNGHVTFGCFNKPEKINSEVIALWADVLRAVPGSKLLLKYFNHYSEPSMQRRWIEKFGACGIGEDRLLLKARSDNRAQHLVLYNEVDIALDPFPFNGATTTFESLTMGVPVVTLLGRHFVDRVAASMVTHAGFPELVAADRTAYVEIAAALANDVGRLGALRNSMRAKLHASPLCDGTTYARSVENAFRDMWRTWCETGSYRGK